MTVITTLLNRLSGKQRINAAGTRDSILSIVEINQLMAAAGSLKKTRGMLQDRFLPFGEQPSTVTGGGLDFADRRAYVAGDDPRFIDWRASARSQQTLLRNYHSELNAAGCIVIDRRPGMAFGTRRRLKVTQAARIGITLGARLLRGGYQLACLLLQKPEYWQPAQSSLALFRQTAMLAASACPVDDHQESHSSWGEIANGLKNRLARGSRLILVSDFLPLDEAEYKALQQLRFDYELTVIQVIDPLEMSLPVAQSISLEYKNCSSLRLNDVARSQQFNRVLQQNLQAQAERFKKMNCGFYRLRTDDELDRLRDVI